MSQIEIAFEALRRANSREIVGAGATLHEACQKALARLGQVGL